MKRAVVLTVLVTSLAISALMYIGNITRPAQAHVINGEELTMYMDHMRRQAHKLGLSIDAKNKALAAFYLQEMGETIEVVQQKFPKYDEVQIAALVKAMMDPYMTPLGKAIDAGDWATAGTAYATLVKMGCNGCHTATQHGFLKIVPNKSNPYNQDFMP